MSNGTPRRAKRLSNRAIISFFLTLFLCSALVLIAVSNRMNVERLEMEQLITEKSAKAFEAISQLLFKTQTMAALIVQGGGVLEDFNRVAATIADDPSILNILIAPGGVVSEVYPLEGNEAVLGLNFFAEGAGNREAMLAKERKQLVFGGPFELVQGGQALVGRLPVFLSGPDGEEYFWGLVSVTLRYPQVLDKAGFGELQVQGFAYEIWRISPDSNEKQVISGSNYNYNKHTRYIEKPISILNAEWYFRILPVRAWYEYPETWIMVFFSTCLSVLVAFVMQNNTELKTLKTKFEDLAKTDGLTRIFNRRHFMELAEQCLTQRTAFAKSAFLIIFDIDQFKSINDTYGHLAGDEVLRETASRAMAWMRTGNLLARYGGEEFIVLAGEADAASICAFAEGLRAAISETPYKTQGFSIPVQASFGIAPVSAESGLDEGIRRADRALYRAKSGGRNRVVLESETPPDGTESGG